MKLLLAFLILAGVLAGVYFWYGASLDRNNAEFVIGGGILYVAVGDLYSGSSEIASKESWPYLLAEDLRKDGLNIALNAVLVKDSGTSEDILGMVGSRFASLNPGFATLLVGANDLTRSVPEDTFRTNFSAILDKMLAVLPDSRRLLVVTIPDFSVAPSSIKLSGQGDISLGVDKLNGVIFKEALSRGVGVADIKALSRDMQSGAFYTKDGLHFSSQGHVLLEKAIRKRANELLIDIPKN